MPNTDLQAKQMVEFLAEEYHAALVQQNQKLAPDSGPLDVNAMMAALGTFRQFCSDYLAMHQPRELITNLDGNYGVKLTNQKSFTIGIPQSAIKGTMQPSSHVAVTGQQTANDMQQQGYIPMTGATNLIPPDSVDFRSAQGQKDMTASQPAIRFDQQDPRTLPSQR